MKRAYDLYFAAFFAADFVLPLPATAASPDGLRGRPVLMTGTALIAASKRASLMSASAMTPARSSSLFLTLWSFAAARCLSRWISWYSALGIVKLSRTGFGSLSLGCLPARTAGDEPLLFVFFFGVLAEGARGSTARAAFTGALLVVGAAAFFLTAGLAGVWVVALVGAWVAIRSRL